MSNLFKAGLFIAFHGVLLQTASAQQGFETYTLSATSINTPYTAKRVTTTYQSSATALRCRMSVPT